MEERECYICLQNEGELITACGCTDSRVHAVCLRKWITVSHRRYCRACRKIYTLQIVEKKKSACFRFFCCDDGIEGIGEFEDAPYSDTE